MPIYGVPAMVRSRVKGRITHWAMSFRPLLSCRRGRKVRVCPGPRNL